MPLVPAPAVRQASLCASCRGCRHGMILSAAPALCACPNESEIAACESRKAPVRLAASGCEGSAVRDAEHRPRRLRSAVHSVRQDESTRAKIT